MRGPTEVANNTTVSCRHTVRYMGTNVSERHFATYIFREIQKRQKIPLRLCVYTHGVLHLQLHLCRTASRRLLQQKRANLKLSEALTEGTKQGPNEYKSNDIKKLDIL